MTVSKGTILNKIKKELATAIEQQNQEKVFMRHIHNLKLLCELIIDEDEQEKKSAKPLSEMKSDSMQIIDQRTEALHSYGKTIDHEEANGDSIFDF